MAPILIAVPGAVTYLKLRSALISRLDQQLVTTAQGSVLHLIDNARNNPPSPQTVWFVQLDPTGTVIDTFPASSTIGNIKHLNASAPERRRLAIPNPRPTGLTTSEGNHLRVISETQPRAVGTVVLGLSTDDTDRTLHELVLIELALGAGAAVLAGLAAYGVRLSLRPLRRLTSTARQITAELSPDGAGLNRRAPLAESEIGSEAGHLTQAVNTLLAAVETQFSARLASEHRMRQFLADASHELRTPLTSIRGYAELARMRRRGQAPTDEDDSMDRIEAEGTRMTRLVDDLLLLARGDQGELPRAEPVDVASLVTESVQLALTSFPPRRIHAGPEAMPHLFVNGDRDQLLRVLRNLLNNAAIHTREDGSIWVSAAADQDQVVVRVIDQGPGLPPDAAQRVFERFWRADQSRVRATGGSGLGMSIVQSIVIAHGGTVRFDSTVQTGTTVEIRLPSSADG